MHYHKPEMIEELIDFNDTSVNSRILAKDNDNMAILLAIKENQLLPEHVSSVDAFVFVVDGEVEFEIEEKTESLTEPIKMTKYTVKKGEIFFFKKNEKHTVLGKKDTMILVIRI